VIWTDTSGETVAGTVKLGEANEKPRSDVVVYTPELWKSILSDQWVSGYQG
jgi:hypothetical protein